MIGNAPSIGAVLDEFGNANIMWNDQTTTPVEEFLSSNINAITIENVVPLGSNTFNLTAGHGCVVGDYLEFHFLIPAIGIASSISYQSEIVSVATNVIRTGLPMSFNMDPTYITEAFRTTVNLGVVGAVDAKIRYKAVPSTGITWDATRMMIDMLCDSQPDDGKFGDIAKLSYGVFFGIERFSGAGALYGLNFKDNADFAASAYDISYASRSVPAGSWGVRVRKSFAGPDKWGVAIRVRASTNDELVAYVQDDLSDISRIRIKIMGHQVTPREG